MSAYPLKNHHFHTEKAKEIYDEVKCEKDQGAKEKKFLDALRQLKDASVKEKTTDLMFFVKAGQSSKKANSTPATKSVKQPFNIRITGTLKKENASSNFCTGSTKVTDNKDKPTKVVRAQQEAQIKLDLATKRVSVLSTFKDRCDPEFKAAVKECNYVSGVLHLKQENARRQRKYYEKRKRKFTELYDTSRSLLNIHAKVGSSSYRGVATRTARCNKRYEFTRVRCT